jgi:hypothetical protein
MKKKRERFRLSIIFNTWTVGKFLCLPVDVFHSAVCEREREQDVIQMIFSMSIPER